MLGYPDVGTSTSLFTFSKCTIFSRRSPVHTSGPPGHVVSSTIQTLWSTESKQRWLVFGIWKRTCVICTNVGSPDISNVGKSNDRADSYFQNQELKRSFWNVDVGSPSCYFLEHSSDLKMFRKLLDSCWSKIAKLKVSRKTIKVAIKSRPKLCHNVVKIWTSVAWFHNPQWAVIVTFTYYTRTTKLNSSN